MASLRLNEVDYDDPLAATEKEIAKKSKRIKLFTKKNIDRIRES